MNATPTAKKAARSNGVCYIGPERRIERRRSNCNRRLESLLKDFGIDRRMARDRRKKNTSWLLMSKAANL